MKTMLRWLLLWVSCGVLSASTSSPLRHIISKFGSDVFFVMDKSTDGEHAAGRCYKIGGNGLIFQLWETKGFYAWPGQLSLSPDGKTLARLHRIPATQEVGNPTLISVYSEGVLAYSLTLDKFLSREEMKPNPFTGDNFVTLNAGVHSPFEIVGRIDYETLSGSKAFPAKEESYYLKISTSNGKISLIELSSGKIVYVSGAGPRE